MAAAATAGKWRYRRYINCICSAQKVGLKVRSHHVCTVAPNLNVGRALCKNSVGFQIVKVTQLGRPRRRWVDNIRTDLGEVGWGEVDWIGLAKDRKRWRALVNSVLNLRVP
jgi:hypothetical protein